MILLPLRFIKPIFGTLNFWFVRKDLSLEGALNRLSNGPWELLADVTAPLLAAVAASRKSLPSPEPGNDLHGQYSFLRDLKICN